MKKVFLSLSAIAMIAFTSCEKKEAVVANEAQEEAVATEEAVDFVADLDNSNVEWRGYKITDGETEEGGHNGTIKLASGDLKVEGNQIVSGSFVIDAATMESLDLAEDADMKGKLEGHLKSADFLDVEKYPTATFTITGVNAIEGDYNTEVSGNLKMREVEKNITFKANVGVEGDVLTLNSEDFTINREDFGIVFQAPEGSLIKNNVTLKVNLSAKKSEDATVAENVEETTEEAAQ